jgi:hypothetical protein
MNEQNVTITRTDNVGHSLMAFNQWANRPSDQCYHSLEDLYLATKQRAAFSHAEEAQLADCHVVGEGESLEVIIPGFDKPTMLTNLGFGQLCTELGIPAGYMRKLPGELVQQNLNHALGKVRERRDMAMIEAAGSGAVFDPKSHSFYHRTDTNQIQAVTSTSYSRVFDHELVEIMQSVTAEADAPFFAPKDWNGNVSGLYASDRDVWMYMIDGGSLVEGPCERDKLYRGIILSNSEVRVKTVIGRSFMFRVTCGNLQIWGMEDLEEISIVHRGKARQHVRDILIPRLRQFVNADTRAAVSKALEAANTTKLPWSVSEKLEDFISWAREPLKGVKFSRKEVCAAVEAAIREEGRCESIWDLVNGFTAVARDIKFAGESANLSARAGRLMALAG